MFLILIFMSLKCFHEILLHCRDGIIFHNLTWIKDKYFSFKVFQPLVFIDAIGKVEKILKGSLYSMTSPSPSVKIEIIWAGKFAWGVKAKHCWALSTNFPVNNFHWRWRWWDQIKAIFLNLFYFKKFTEWLPVRQNQI